MAAAGQRVLEAAQAGCALLLGDIESLRENWDGAALFVTPHDRQAWTEALTRVIGDEDFQARLASRAEARAPRFNVENMARAYLASYCRLLSARQKSARRHSEGLICAL